MSVVVNATGQAPLTVTNHGIMVGAGSGGAVSNTAINLTDGQVLIGNTGGAPTAGTLTQGTGITITSVGGSITIAATGGGYSTVHETSSTVTLVALTQYVMDKSTLITATLPTTAAIGDSFIIVGVGSGGWQVNVASGQTIQVGATACTASSGSIASTNQFDCCTLVCVTANTTFVTMGVQGGLTVA